MGNTCNWVAATCFIEQPLCCNCNHKALLVAIMCVAAQKWMRAVPGHLERMTLLPPPHLSALRLPRLSNKPIPAVHDGRPGFCLLAAWHSLIDPRCPSPDLLLTIVLCSIHKTTRRASQPARQHSDVLQACSPANAFHYNFPPVQTRGVEGQNGKGPFQRRRFHFGFEEDALWEKPCTTLMVSRYRNSLNGNPSFYHHTDTRYTNLYKKKF